MIKKRIQAARGKRATNKDPAAITPSADVEWVTEPIPTPEQDALRTERDERQDRLDFLNRLINGVR